MNTNKPTKIKPVKVQKLHYVDNKEFLLQMTIHIESVNEAKKEGKPLPKVSDYIGSCILNIANKLVNRPNFMNYPFREEMIADGIENCLLYLNNFNPQKSNNPFAYFTQIIYFAFIRRIQREKKQLYTKYKVAQHTLLHDVHESDNPNTPTKYGNEYSDNFMNEFMENFEKGREVKKKKARTRKVEPINLEATLDFDD